MTRTLGKDDRLRMAFGAAAPATGPAFKFQLIIRLKMAKISLNAFGRDGRMRGNSVMSAKHPMATIVSSSSVLRTDSRVGKQGVLVISYSLGMVF
jgi:hypothetical protein